MPERLHVFVASSSEQLSAAEKVADAIKVADHADGKPVLDVQPWQEDVFNFSAAYIESLEKELDVADFAIVVLTGDDSANVRGTTVNLPRDNVIFELGLFIGRLGRDRCFFFVDGDSATAVASDLSGVKPVEFYEHANSAVSRRPLLKTQAQKVRGQMLSLGARYKPSRETRSGQDELWRISTRMSGAWWERMRRGEDDMSALSYVMISADEVNNTPKLEGKAFGTDGEYHAEWYSVASAVELTSSTPVVYYRWVGEVDVTRGQQYGGGGQIDFDDLELRTASGYYYDTNYALLNSDAKTRMKRFRLYRCEPNEAEIMKQHWTDEAKSLVLHKLSRY